MAEKVPNNSQVSAARIRPPFDGYGGTANDFQCRKFTAPDTAAGHAANALPAAWHGRWVRLKLLSGGPVHWGFSVVSTAEVDASVAATAAGASSKVGDVLSSSFPTDEVQLPDWDPNQSCYFVREAATGATGVVLITLRDH